MKYNVFIWFLWTSLATPLWAFQIRNNTSQEIILCRYGIQYGSSVWYHRWHKPIVLGSRNGDLGVNVMDAILRAITLSVDGVEQTYQLPMTECLSFNRAKDGAIEMVAFPDSALQRDAVRIIIKKSETWD